jgi:hypothetical protein
MTGTTHKAVDDTLRVVPMSTLSMHTPQAEILSSFFLMQKVSALPDPVANHSREANTINVLRKMIATVPHHSFCTKRRARADLVV